MTPEQQRIAIAEACPKLFYGHHGKWFLHSENPRSIYGMPNEVDVLTDLNAMHEATACLDETINQNDICLRDVFSSELEEIFSRSKTEPEIWSMFDLLTATAQQRAEAFLRTIGKWKE